ncbi:MAG TPA: protein kinase [Candidatus Udaeobacter sp.]|nr:protein kinase [Candidatus Udaeobacter sp.]
MKPERWQQINDLFQSTTDCAPEQRAAFLDEACRGDEDLRHEVESLVTAYERTENFIEAPAFEVAPELLLSEKGGQLIGELIGHYRIESLIGVGGMGEVYLARDGRLGRKVALKLLPVELMADQIQVSRFKTEARAASALNHPNILTVYEISSEGDRQFIATEFIEGVTLRARLAQGRINLGDTLEVAVQVASGLTAAHEAGVVHRDIKPENIMLRPDGYVKVLDFGIAKLSKQPRKNSEPVCRDAGKIAIHQTRSGLVLGTARYMSPEQTRGEQADARSDIWSLGVVIYEMVAGIPPFRGDTPRDCRASILRREPPPLSRISSDIPPKLEWIVKKALSKNKNDRYQTSREMLADLRSLKVELGAKGGPFETGASVKRTISKSERHKRGALVALAALLFGVLAVFLPGSLQKSHGRVATAQDPTSNLPIPEKSIAVLPFENLSGDPDSAFFADGVQDEILTDLARIADLKVIGRTSVMRYRSGVARNLRKIGEQLGVAHLVEGTVQHSGNRVRVNAQLVDARTDQRLWGQIYDRDLADVFAIESEIATAIAGELNAKLSPNEKSEIERPTTGNISAFDLYTRANNLLLTASFSDDVRGHLRQAAHLLNQAIARDQTFFQAYCQLAYVHDRLYFYGYDHTPARLALAEAAIQTAFRLRQDAGEAHRARAENLYCGYRDYDGALAELEIARRSLPNDARIFKLMGYVQRRAGRWEESARSLERAVELDPRDLETLQEIAVNDDLFRKYAEEKMILDRALAIEPDRVETKVVRANLDLDSKGDTRPLHQVIDEIRATNSAAIQGVANNWLICALAERDATAARAALTALGEAPLRDGTVEWSRPLVEGLIARMTHDDDKARAAFTAALADQEKIVEAEPNYGPARCVLGLINAALGRKEEALREGRRAIELLPMEKDAMWGPAMIRYLAKVAAWVGDNDLACEQLAIATRVPSGVSYGQLKLMPWWDPLRGDPCFEEIVASLAPKTSDK